VATVDCFHADKNDEMNCSVNQDKPPVRSQKQTFKSFKASSMHAQHAARKKC